MEYSITSSFVVISNMRNYSVTSSNPFGSQDLVTPLIEYTVILEDDGGYVETQKYACIPTDMETVLSDALDVFCDSRASLEVDALAFLR